MKRQDDGWGGLVLVLVLVLDLDLVLGMGSSTSRTVLDGGTVTEVVVLPRPR